MTWKIQRCPHCKREVFEAAREWAKLKKVWLDVESEVFIHQLKDSVEVPVIDDPRPRHLSETFIEHRFVCPKFDADLQQMEAPPDEAKEEIPL